jgi:hypothetical protein
MKNYKNYLVFIKDMNGLNKVLEVDAKEDAQGDGEEEEDVVTLGVAVVSINLT